MKIFGKHRTTMILAGLLLLVLVLAWIFLWYLRIAPNMADSPTSQENWQLYGYLQTTGEKNLKRPMQVISYKDKILVSDSGNGQIVAYSKKGKLLNYWSGQPPQKLIFPYDMAVLDDQLLVSDPELGKILRFSMDGSYLGTFPDTGSPLKRPAGLALSADRLYVTDLDLHQVLLFDLKGRLVSRWGSGHSGNTYNDFSYPNDILVQNSLVYVSDTGNNRVQIFNSQGQYQKTISHPEQADLVNNRGLAISPKGNLMVASSMTNSILLFSATGKYLNSFAGLDSKTDNLFMPNGLTALDYQGSSLVAIADKGNNRVSIYYLPENW